jgi:hypothetical protein
MDFFQEYSEKRMRNVRLMKTEKDMNMLVHDHESTVDVRIETAQIMSIPQMFHS